MHRFHPQQFFFEYAAFPFKIITMERRCAKLSWSCLNSDSYVVKTIAKSAKCSMVSHRGHNCISSALTI